MLYGKFNNISIAIFVCGFLICILKLVDVLNCYHFVIHLISILNVTIAIWLFNFANRWLGISIGLELLMENYNG